MIDFVILSKDFPKELVLAEDTGTDSLKQNFVIPVDSSKAIIGSITIVQNGTEWQMINKGFNSPGTYIIKTLSLLTMGVNWFSMMPHFKAHKKRLP